MTLLHYDGFDLGVMYSDYSLSSPGQVVTGVNTSPFGVGRALQVNGGYISKSIPATQEVYTGVYTTCYGGGAQNGGIQFWGDGGTTAHISISWSTTTIVAKLGGYTSVIALGTAGAWSLPVSFWSHMQVYVKIADTGGRVTIKINDVTVYDYTGDTKNGGTLSSCDTVRISREDSGAAHYWDDWWICDAAGAAPFNTFLGAARVRTYSPSGAGASTAFTPSSGANYTCVDEQPYVTTDYVTAVGAVSGTRDTYAVTDMPSAGVVPLAVKSIAVAKKTGADPVSLKPVLRSGGTNYSATAVPLGTVDAQAAGIWTADPATSAAWTVAGVNAAEVGFEVA